MQFIKAKNSDAGMQVMADRISSALIQGKKVLWLICGGSNIPIAVQAMSALREDVPEASLKLLTVAQTDERYGPVGHPDSNWKQMLDGSFNFTGVRAIPMLTGESLQETVAEYERVVMPIFEEVLTSGGLVLGQFGMGEDGHIAGILPHTPAVNNPKFVSGYEGKPFTRISLTPPALMKITCAYAFVYGNSKGSAVRRLRDESVSIDEEPAQILKKFKEAYLYSDQV